MRELKETNIENRRLIKELAAKESTVGLVQKSEDSFEVNGITVVKRDFGEVIDVNRMLQTATEVIKRNEAAVSLFYGSDGKTCRIMIMSGTTAITKGFNAGKIVKEVAPLFGGGGGDRPNFAQGGGTKCDKLKETVHAAEELMKKQLKA